MVSTELLAERDVSLPSRAEEPATASTRTRCEIVQRLRQAVLQQPGGAAEWDAMVNADGRVRGKVANARLRMLLEVIDPAGSLRRTAGVLGTDGSPMRSGATDAS